MVAALLLGATLLGACGLPSQPPSSGQVIQVVAAENFWGSIAAQVGGSHVQVTSIISDPNADPHSYEPTAQNARTVAGARLRHRQRRRLRSLGG